MADAQTISLPDSKAHQDLSRDTAIVIPSGDFLSLENLWWVRSLEKANDSSNAYRNLMRKALAEIHRCLERGEDFDVTVDDGHPITNYRRIVRLTDQSLV